MGNKYWPSELICLQCRKTHVDQEHVGPENRVDEASDRSHVVDEEQVEAKKKYDHRGNHVKDHEENSNRNQAQIN